MTEHKVLQMTPENERKAEMTLVLKVEEQSSAGAKRQFCKDLGVEWDEYLHLKRKYSRILERYKKENKTNVLQF